MKLECSICGREYDYNKLYLECPYCKGNLVFKYDKEYNERFLTQPTCSIWRYSLLPFKDGNYISMGEGCTPQYIADNLSRALGFNGILIIKNEAANPTGSFIDRGVSIAITHAYKNNFRRVATASPGNLGASLAAYAAKAGMDALVYIPTNIETGKLYQILMYNAEAVSIENLEEGFERTKELLLEGYYPLLPNNPYYIEGLKTISFEILEGLGWMAPDTLITPMGSGALIYSMYKGFREAFEYGLVDNIPRFIGVQVKGYSPIVDRILGEELTESDKAIPELSIVPPMNMPLAMEAIKDSGGNAIRVDYSDVLEALKLLSRYEGVLVEVAAASTIAVLKELRAELSGEKVLIVLTGEGLKDPVTVRELTKGVRRRLGLDVSEVSRIGRTKLKILNAIKSGHDYGYSIWRYLSSHGINIKLPTIYQHLNELERLGLVKLKSRIGLTRQKAVYVLTKKGEELTRLFPE